MNRKPLAVLIIASSIAAFGSLAQAQSSPMSRGADTRSASGVEFKSGGVGLLARQELASQSSQYNLHLEFAYAPEGEYLAGSYTVKASVGAVTRTQQVTVGGGKRHLVMRFPAQVENMANRSGSSRSDSGSSASVASR
jgi:hypothetical protein